MLIALGKRDRLAEGDEEDTPPSPLIVAADRRLVVARQYKLELRRKLEELLAQMPRDYLALAS
jgi:hypothetical protein